MEAEDVVITTERGFRKKVTAAEQKAAAEKEEKAKKKEEKARKRLKAVEERTGKKREDGGEKNTEEQPELVFDKPSQKRHKGEDQKYVLFVGNLPFKATKEDVLEHFADVGEIKNFRLPKDKDTDQPKGFGFLEVADATAFENAVGLHHSYMMNRRINVEWTFPGGSGSTRRRHLIKNKSSKLHQLSKKGKIKRLAGKREHNR